MRDNPLKAMLAEGRPLVGLMCFEFSTSGIARLAAAAGADFVLFDMEHTGWSIETVRQLIAASRGTARRRWCASPGPTGISCPVPSTSAPPG